MTVLPTDELRLTAIAALDAALDVMYGNGLDSEQTALLMSQDHAHIAGALDDWEARLGMDVSALRSAALPADWAEDKGSCVP